MQRSFISAAALCLLAATSAQAGLVTLTTPQGDISIPDKGGNKFPTPSTDIGVTVGFILSMSVSATASDGAFHVKFSSYEYPYPALVTALSSQDIFEHLHNTKGPPTQATIPLSFSTPAAQQSAFAIDIKGFTALHGLLAGIGYKYSYQLTASMIDSAGNSTTLLDVHPHYEIPGVEPYTNPTDDVWIRRSYDVLNDTTGAFDLHAVVNAGSDLSKLVFRLEIPQADNYLPSACVGLSVGSACMKAGESFPEYILGINEIVITPLSAVPEPGTYALMGLGLVALGLTARQRGKHMA